MKRPDALTVLALVAGVVIAGLTGVAFWLSYAHLAEIANGHGLRHDQPRAWAWPATLDAFIVAGELLMLRAVLAGRVDWWAIVLTVAGAGGSIVLNVWGVGKDAHPLDYVVAGVPPTAALLAFGALMHQLHEHLTRDELPARNEKRNEIPADRDPLRELAEVRVARMTGAVPERPEREPETVVERVPEAPAPVPVLGDFKPLPLPPLPPEFAATPPATPVAPPVAAEPDAVALLSVADVAEQRGVAEATVRSWVARKKLTPVQRDDDGRLLFHPDAVAALD